MPNISLVITGTGEWKRYTKPFIDSILKYAPGFHIVCVDNGSQYPDVDGVQMVKLPEITSYPAVLNAGMRAYKADWYFLCNNDMLITKPLSSSRFEGLNPLCLYSWIKVVDKIYKFEYLESWSMFISDVIHRTIGGFDENFKPMWFEGADYCIRAVKEGFHMAEPLDRIEWGVYHLEDERMIERKAYMQEHMPQRLANREYLMSKHGLPRKLS